MSLSRWSESCSVVSDALQSHGLHGTCQTSLFMEFSRQEYWSGYPFPSPGDLLYSGIEPQSPAVAGRFFTTEPPWKFFLIALCCSITQSCPTLCDPMDCSMPGLPVLHHLPELAPTHVHWVVDAIQSSHLLSSPSPPASIFPSIRVFSNESALHSRWPKYWSFSFSISPSNEYSGLISFWIDWFDLLTVLGTLKSLLQHHSSKASIFCHSAFFMVQLSHPYMTTGYKVHECPFWVFNSIICKFHGTSKWGRLSLGHLAFLNGVQW